MDYKNKHLDRIQIKSLRLNNFRNYSGLECSFNEHINVITGLNGAGKTSILDAIYYLSNAKSYHAHLDSYIYKQGSDYFFLQGLYLLDDEKYEIEIQSSRSKAKQLKLDDKLMKSMAEFVGRFPAFMIAPKDILILVESSVERRRLIDKTISQVDKFYFKSLLAYNKLLKQRNAALKSFLKSGRVDHLILDALDAKMIEHANTIHNTRKDYIKAISPIANAIYNRISSNSEDVTIEYKSKLSDTDFEQLCKDSRMRDLATGKSNEGIHRDDLILKLNGMDIRKTGSQGQLKTAIIAIKLAQVEWVKSALDRVPIILLDDIFDKLDNTRVENLLDICASELNAQIFISDTEADRIVNSLKKLNLQFTHFNIQNGELIDE